MKIRESEYNPNKTMILCYNVVQIKILFKEHVKLLYT